MLRIWIVVIFLTITAIGCNRTMEEEIDYTKIFMEHPSGEFENVRDALIFTIEKLHKYKNVDRWLNIYGQGKGYIDSVIKIKGKFIDIGEDYLDIENILNSSGINIAEKKINRLESGNYDLGDFSSSEIGAIMDAIFRVHFKVKPHEGERDYTLGAEWI